MPLNLSHLFMNISRLTQVTPLLTYTIAADLRSPKSTQAHEPILQTLPVPHTLTALLQFTITSLYSAVSTYCTYLQITNHPVKVYMYGKLELQAF